MMTRIQLNEDLEAIVANNNVRSMIFDLIVWAESRGRIGQLISGALTANPDNPELVQLVRIVQNWPGLALHSEPNRTPQPVASRWYLAHPYGMPPHFTGRTIERNALTKWASDTEHNALLLLRAEGGFGKSALAWYWLIHDVNTELFPRVVWWSFYEGDAHFDSFLAATLSYLEVEITGVPPWKMVNLLIERMYPAGLLLILDGFERHLRAYSDSRAVYQADDVNLDVDRRSINSSADYFLRCVTALPRLQSKVLITSRLRPHVLESPDGQILEGCLEMPLPQMRSDEAVAFLRRHGIHGSRAEIKLACEYYGCHPLSLRLLVGLLATDVQQPNDIAASARVNIFDDLRNRRGHILDEVYGSLTPQCKDLLCSMACFRSSISYSDLHSLNEDTDADFDNNLRQLVTKGLVHRELSTNSFDLHPIIRHYAYSQLVNKALVHKRLHDYYLTVNVPPEIHSYEEMIPIKETVFHSIAAGLYDEAFEAYRTKQFNYILRYWGLHETALSFLEPLIQAAIHGDWAATNYQKGWLINERGVQMMFLGKSMDSELSFQESIKWYALTTDSESLWLAPMSRPQTAKTKVVSLSLGRGGSTGIDDNRRRHR